MEISYYKRYRMEINLIGRDFSKVPVPTDYRLLPWSESLLEPCAITKYLSFRNELDSKVFPCLGDIDGCRRLMGEISRRPGFLPETTWLGVYWSETARKPRYCGTIQGIRDKSGLGSIQNLGVVPKRRNSGLGTALLAHSLEGFRNAGILRVTLEVTAQNEDAIRLYRRLGFVAVKTVYKTVDMFSIPQY